MKWTEPRTITSASIYALSGESSWLGGQAGMRGCFEILVTQNWKRKLLASPQKKEWNFSPWQNLWPMISLALSPSLISLSSQIYKKRKQGFDNACKCFLFPFICSEIFHQKSKFLLETLWASNVLVMLSSFCKPKQRENNVWPSGEEKEKQYKTWRFKKEDSAILVSTEKIETCSGNKVLSSNTEKGTPKIWKMLQKLWESMRWSTLTKLNIKLQQQHQSSRL